MAINFLLKWRRAYTTLSHSNFAKNYSANSSVKSVDLEPSSRLLKVKWSNSIVDHYPFIWLRDNCQCPLCFNSSAQSRKVNLHQLNLNATPNTTISNHNGIEVTWDDGHHSIYSYKWLQERSFSKETQKKWVKSNQMSYSPWKASFVENFPTYEFKDIVNNDETLLRWLSSLKEFGISLLVNLPRSLGQNRVIADRIAFIKKTHYGEEFSVQAKPGPNNVAYTAGYLQLHTDLPYYEYKPGINLLHCFVQYAGEGGDSLIADGFNVANLLQQHDPEAYKILVDTDVSWADIGQEDGNHFHNVHIGPVICTRKDGEIFRINYSQPQRDSHLPIPLEKVEPWYKALKKFCDLAHHPQNLIQFKLQEGQMLTFNNLRVLHGRTAFGNEESGERHVIGSYVDWDEALSRIRVLKAKLKVNDDHHEC